MKSDQQILSKLEAIETLLAAQRPKPMTVEEAAAYLNLSRSYLYKLTSLGLVPFYKPQGKLLYFEKRDLDSWLLRNRVRSASELETEVEGSQRSGGRSVK